jgi:hypothetical protein
LKYPESQKTDHAQLPAHKTLEDNAQLGGVGAGDAQRRDHLLLLLLLLIQCRRVRGGAGLGRHRPLHRKSDGFAQHSAASLHQESALLMPRLGMQTELRVPGVEAQHLGVDAHRQVVQVAEGQRNLA